MIFLGNKKSEREKKTGSCYVKKNREINEIYRCSVNDMHRKVRKRGEVKDTSCLHGLKGIFSATKIQNGDVHVIYYIYIYYTHRTHVLRRSKTWRKQKGQLIPKSKVTGWLCVRFAPADRWSTNRCSCLALKLPRDAPLSFLFFHPEICI